jgi:hypothetical protein
VVNSSQYGDSSLIFNRPIELTGTTLPILQFYTRYRMGGGTGRVEVSTNGGFDWTINNLAATTGGFVCQPSSVVCNATVTGEHWPSDPSQWQLRRLNLSNYVSNGLIHLRFHMTTQTWVEDGWYITDLSVGGSLAP